MARAGPDDDSGGNRIEADGAAAEFIDDDLQDPAVRPVEAARIDFQPVQGIVGQGRRNRPGFGNLGEVADALQEAVGNTRRPPRAAGDFQGAVIVNGHVEDIGRPLDDED